jgi:hypothetical protein
LSLVCCHDGNPAFAAAVVESGWLYGARLPSTVYRPVWFADQDWREPDRGAYMAALAAHRPAMATVLDWERDGQFAEVMGWAEEAARHVTEAVVVVPKVVGGVPRVPDAVGGRRVVLGYSVPTRYGGSPVPLWEHAGRPVHLLGGSPQEQLRLWYAFGGVGCEVVSADGNMAAQQARRGRYWSRSPGPKGHWKQLRDSGDEREDGVPLECFRRSLRAIRDVWCERRAAWTAPR